MLVPILYCSQPRQFGFEGTNSDQLCLLDGQIPCILQQALLDLHQLQLGRCCT